MGEPRYVAVGRLVGVRMFTRRDVDRWLAWPRHADPLFSTYDPVPMDGSMRDAWYDDLVNRQGQLPFAIETADRRMIGRLFLRHVRKQDGSSVLGIDLDPRCLGRGFGTDALRAFLRYYFGPARFRRMYLSVAAYNARARRSYERCGFRYLGTYWDTFKTEADPLVDPRYVPLRSCFRVGPRGLETLMYNMVVDRPPPAMPNDQADRAPGRAGSGATDGGR